MPKNLWQKKFNSQDDYVWRSSFGEFKSGDTVVKEEITNRRLIQLYDARMIVRRDVWNEFVGADSAADKSRVVDFPAPVDDTAHLRQQLEALGVEVDGRWKEKRLLEELEKATAPAPTLPGVNNGAA